MTVKFRVSVWAGDEVYQEGEIYPLPDKLAKDYIAQGRAAAVTEQEEETSKKGRKKKQ